MGAVVVVKDYNVDTSNFSESDIKTFGDLYKYKNDEFYNYQDGYAGLYHGPFLYDVLFDANGKKMVNTDDFDFYKKFAEFKVLSINYTSVGDAIELD